MTHAAPLVLGLALSVVAGVVRVVGWHRVVAAACPGCGVRLRDVVLAHLGGAGLNGFVPAHGGDAVKVALLKRRAPAASLGLLLGSLAPPAAAEALFTALLVLWALTSGFVVVPAGGELPLPLVAAGVAAVTAVVFVIARRAPNLVRDVWRGMTALRHPKLMLRGVMPWLLAARVLRLAAIACFMAAVDLPVVVSGALLVMAVQGGVGSIGPATTPMRVAFLVASLPAVLGIEVSAAMATALMGTQIAASGVNLAISMVVVAAAIRTTSPRVIWRYCRTAATRVPALPRPAPGEARP